MTRIRCESTMVLIAVFGVFIFSIGGLGVVEVSSADPKPGRSSEEKSIALSDEVTLAKKDLDDTTDKPASGKSDGTLTRRLLDTLKQQNAGKYILEDLSLRTLKEIVELGSDAVPDLIVELDQTQDETMIRCLGFTLRAIGDKRAVPALIRAIPKTFCQAGSDFSVDSNDSELVKFAQMHDLSLTKKENRYSFCRPVREVSGALQKMTGKKLGERDLFHVQLGECLRNSGLSNCSFNELRKGGLSGGNRIGQTAFRTRVMQKST